MPIGDISQLRQKDRLARRGRFESETEKTKEIDILCDDIRPTRENTNSFICGYVFLIHLRLRLLAATWVIEGLALLKAYGADFKREQE